MATQAAASSGWRSRLNDALLAQTDALRRQQVWREHPLIRVFTVLIVLLVSLPLGYLILRAVGAGDSALAYLTSQSTLRVIGNSIILMIAVVISAALIGVPFAWLTTRTDLPLRRFWLVTGLLTMVIPSYIGAMMYIAAFGPRGLLQGILEPLGVTQLPSIYGFFGAWLAITLFSYPYVVLPVRTALLNLDPALEESARSLGLSRWRAFWRVTLPQLRPALGVGMLLTALYTLSDFGAVSLMRYDAFTHAIYLQYTSSFDRSRAAMLSLVLVALTVVLLVLERRMTHVQSRRNYRLGSGISRRLRRVALGRWKFPALLFCGALVGIGVFAPVAVLTLWMINALRIGLPVGEILQPTLNSGWVSLLSAGVVAVIAIPPALLAVRSRSRFDGWLVQLAYIGNALPGLVIALALVFFAANYLPALYQTMPVLILGYSVRFLPLGIGATRSALTQINPRCEEAARSLGLRSWQVTLRVTAPLARAGILGGIALVFLNVMKELPTTLLLSPTGYSTLPMVVWSANSAAMRAQIGAPALVLIAVSSLSLLLLLQQQRKGG